MACVGVDAGTVMDEAVLRLLCGDMDMDMWLVLWVRKDKSSSLSSLIVRWGNVLVKIVLGGVAGMRAGGGFAGSAGGLFVDGLIDGLAAGLITGQLADGLAVGLIA